MRKFLLYFLLFVFVTAVGMFAYGFYRAGKIRGFAAEVSQVRAKHDLGPRIEEIQKSFADSGKKDVTQIRDESADFAEKLDGITKESEAAKNEIGGLSAPGPTGATKQLAMDYYSRIEKQSDDLKGIIAYMSQVIGVAAVFGEVEEATTLDEMKNIIARAKERGNAVETNSLPRELAPSAQALKETLGFFVIKMEETAQLKSENSAELDASYEDFSKKESDFFTAAKNYVDGMENIDIISARLNEEVARLQGIYFSLR